MERKTVASAVPADRPAMRRERKARRQKRKRDKERAEAAPAMPATPEAKPAAGSVSNEQGAAKGQGTVELPTLSVTDVGSAVSQLQQWEKPKRRRGPRGAY